MDRHAADEQLRRDGFRHVFAWRDAPYAYYPDHTHAVDTAHVILDGEMSLTIGGVTTTYRAGDRPPDVPAGAVHAARMGAHGCYYVVGEK
jgi:quercetin dioxygenase-like cupin family protein